MPKAVLIVPVAMALLTGFCVYLDHEEKLLKESQEHELRMLLERENAVLKGSKNAWILGRRLADWRGGAMKDAYVLVIKSWFDTDNPDETVIDLAGCFSTFDKAKKAEDEIWQHLDLTAPFYDVEVRTVRLRLAITAGSR